MLARYSGSIGAALLVTAALIYWMQLMIASGGSAIVAPVVYVSPPFAPPPDILTPVRSLTTVVVVERIPRPTLPTSVTTPVFPRTDRPVPAGPATPPGPPDPQGRPDGPRGPWIADTDLMVLSRIAPVYPFRNISRAIEGAVVVEFTVTRRGTVENVVVVESTHEAFEAATVDAVSRWSYRPKVVDGAPVDVPGVRQRIVFELEN